jgi:hypothetical protein
MWSMNIIRTTTIKFTDKQRRVRYDLVDLLDKLGLKTRPILYIEPLETTLKCMTFDSSNLVLWPNLPKS